MTSYKAWKMPGIGEKPIWVIVDETGKTINKSPIEDELKGLKGFPKENYKIERRKKYTDEELLRYPIQFYEKYGRPPTKEDFKSNPEYPNCQTCVNRFGSWINFLKLTGFDVDTMVKNGVIENEYQKGRFGEIIIRDHFKRHPIDLAGKS